MSHYPFASYADRVVGLRLSLKATGFEAVRFKRSKPAPGNPGGFRADATEPEHVMKVTRNFSFTLAVPDEKQAGLLAVEAAGWGFIHYVATTAFLLGVESPFAANGNETNLAPNSPGATSMANRVVDFDFSLDASGGDGSTLNWKSEGGASGRFTFTLENPGFIIGLRLCPTNDGMLILPDTANPWSEARSIGWPGVGTK